MRNRLINADFWGSPKIGRLSPHAKLLFIALWNFADDYGVASGSRRKILGDCFENDESVSMDDLEIHLKTLEKEGCIEFFNCDKGKEWVGMPSWCKYQKLIAANRSKKRNPVPPWGDLFPDLLKNIDPALKKDFKNLGKTLGQDFKNLPNKNKNKKNKTPPPPPSGTNSAEVAVGVNDDGSTVEGIDRETPESKPPGFGGAAIAAGGGGSEEFNSFFKKNQEMIMRVRLNKARIFKLLEKYGEARVLEVLVYLAGGKGIKDDTAFFLASLKDGRDLFLDDETPKEHAQTDSARLALEAEKVREERVERERIQGLDCDMVEEATGLRGGIVFLLMQTATTKEIIESAKAFQSKFQKTADSCADLLKEIEILRMEAGE